MTDFNVHAYRWCSTNEHFETTAKGSKGETYTVRYGKTPAGPYQYGWTCSCKGFKFRGDCKHVKAAEQERCGHGWEAACGSPAEMGDNCPKCGSETTVIRVAV